MKDYHHSVHDVDPVTHASSGKKGGFAFVTLRHIELRDITAEMLGEICKDVKIEPMPSEIEKGEEIVKKVTTKPEKLDWT